MYAALVERVDARDVLEKLLGMGELRTPGKPGPEQPTVVYICRKIVSPAIRNDGFTAEIASVTTRKLVCYGRESFVGAFQAFADYVCGTDL